MGVGSRATVVGVGGCGIGERPCCFSIVETAALTECDMIRADGSASLELASSQARRRLPLLVLKLGRINAAVGPIGDLVKRL